MLAKFRINHPFLYAIVVYAVFTVVFNLVGWLYSNVFSGLLSASDAMDEAMSSLIGEIAAAAALCFVLYRTGKLGLLTKKGKGFFGGLAVGGFCLGCIVMYALRSFAGEDGSDPLAVNFTATSLVYVLSMMMVGVAEELEARALIAETFLEHFGTAREAALKAALISGFFFGIMHITNLASQSVSETLPQVVLCVTSGILYGAIYFRSGNLWSIVVIHGLNDVAASLSTWLFAGGAEAASEAASEAAAFSMVSLVPILLIGALDIAVALFLLRKSKAAEIEENWPEIAAVK